MNFQQDLPRLYQLFQKSDRQHPDNYFPYVDSPLSSLLADESYRRLDERLSRLDVDALENLVARAAPLVTVRDRDHGRHWTALFNVLNEAKGYEFLLGKGYTKIQFIPVSQERRTPDLVAHLLGSGAVLEVKTISRSDWDISSVGKVFNAEMELPEGLKLKLKASYTEATEQCRAFDPPGDRKWYAYFIIELDARIAVSRSNIPRLEEFIRGIGNDQCELVYESGVWS